MTPLQQIEGTWEEICARDAELVGMRVRLIVLLPLEAASEPKRRLLAREMFHLPTEERERILTE